MKSKTFKNDKGEKITIKSREIESRKNIELEKHPGITTEQYREGIEVRGGKPFSKTLVFTRNSSEGTGDYDFTGFGFKPKSYQIKSYYNVSGSNVRWSDSFVDESGDETCTAWSHNPSSLNTVQFTPNNSIYIRFNSTSSNYTRATHDSYISDGIRMNFSNSTYSIKCVITAYS